MAKNIIDEENLNSKENIDESTNNIQIKENTTNSIFTHDYIPIICVSIAFFVFICVFSTVFALFNRNSSKIVEGVSINGIDLSGLTFEEATQKVTSEFSKKLNSTITLTYNEYISEFIPSEDIDASYNVSEAVEKAYSIGRTNNIIKNNYDILISLLGSRKIIVDLEYNPQKLNTYLDTVSSQIPGLVRQPSYYIEDSNLIIVPGTSGVHLLQDKAKYLILSNVYTLDNSNFIELPIENTEADKINLNKIYNEIYSEPENAYLIQEPFELNVGTIGIDFAISMADAENLLSEEKQEYVIPLKITPPEISVADLGNDIFADKLGTFTSYFNESNVNRSTNVKLATNKINNVILLPGEEFSYNKIVGERTFENGFREASVYTSSGVVNGLGGGICQVSSTLYNSVLLANLDIVERKNHRYAVSYVPLGRDATVAYGSIDFRFKNNRKYPIKIVAYSSSGTCSISIMGIKEANDYDVIITTNKLQTIPYQTKYIDDSSLTIGTEEQTQYGDYGYKYETYKTLKLNGDVISTEVISNDSYTPLTRIVKRGTKQPSTPPPSTEVSSKPNSNSSNISSNTNASTSDDINDNTIDTNTST